VVWNYASLVLSTDLQIDSMRFPVGAKWMYVTIDRGAQDLANNYRWSPSAGHDRQWDQVLVVWPAALHYRHFRYSTDSASWSRSVRAFWRSNGQAGDGLAVDGAGRIHYFTQIRFPMGIYHAYWDGEAWSAATLIYFIRYSGDKSTDTTIVEAHAVHPAIRAGNEVVVSFADEPSHPTRGVYLMTTILSDIQANPVNPLPPGSFCRRRLPPKNWSHGHSRAVRPRTIRNRLAVTSTAPAPVD
jgi:hypothetical protein